MLVEKFPYKSISRTMVDGVRLYDTESGPLPSVTTILAHTKSEEKKQSLEIWRKRIGNAEADRITTEASNVGTLMHSYLEDWLVTGEFNPGTNLIHKIASKMARVIIDNISSDLNEIWGSEVALYSPELYAGTADLPGVWRGQPAIMDFKQSNKLKKEEWIDEYKMQLVAYALAHNEMFGTNIRTAHNFICTRNYEFQLFSITEGTFDFWAEKWAEKVEQYYKTINN